MLERPLTGTPSLLRAINARTILELIQRDGPVSRATWARETGLPRWISSRMVRALIARSRLGVPASGRSGTAPPLYS